MFDYKQEIGILHGSLLSAACSKSGSLFDCDDVKNAASIIHNSIKNIISYNLKDIKEQKEAIKRQLQINEKLHAAVFFTTLRSYGIISTAADTFYNSIVYSWPTIDFKVYVELNFKCDWSEYFIKCALQLAPEILYKVLQIILSIPFFNHIEYYSWHLILQTLILKVLEVPYENENDYPFDFDFTVVKGPFDKNHVYNEVTVMNDADTIPDEPDAVTMLKEMLISLISCISHRMKESDGDAIAKVLCHAVKTLLRNLIEEDKRNFKNVPQFVIFLKIYELLKEYLLTDANKEALKATLQNCSCRVVCHAYITTSWNICMDYLIFLLDYYSNVLYSDCYVQLRDHNELVFEEMIYTPIYDILNKLNSPFLNTTSPKLDQRLKMLHKIIQFDFKGSSFAAKIILQSDPSIIERSGILTVLVENSRVIDLVHHYQLIIGCIHAMNSSESKLQLLKMFYKLLHENDIELYDTVLSYILSHYGVTEEFQLPDFDENFSQFIRKTPTLKEAEEMSPPLFVQNPVIVMKYLIDQALVQGSEGKVFIELLRHFKQTCLHSKNFSMPFLSYVLNEYFEKSKLEVYESKNMITLYKFLAEVQVEVTVLSTDSFFKCCLIPKLQPEQDKIYLILECVHVLLPALLSNRFTDLQLSIITSLISSLGNIIAHCIETGNGKLKAFVIPVLKELEIYQQENKQIADKEKENLWLCKFQHVNEMVCVYVKDFLPGNIDFSSKSFLWTWCCKNKNSYFFQEKFSCETLTYPVLLNILIEVLPHLTKEEWLYSLQLLKICCRNQSLKNEIIHSFNCLFMLSKNELDLYVIISCIITSLHFILNGKVCDSLYISSCFSNSLMNFVNQEESMHINMLITIFLDICYLVQCVSPDFIQIFTAVLLELKKLILDSSSVQANEKHCKRLISIAIECLPDSPEKYILYQKLCK